MTNLTWHQADTSPEVPVGSEKLFWIAVKRPNREKLFVFLSYYQNRPLLLDEYGDPDPDYCICDENGEAIASVGWVENKAHAEFEDFYTPITFNKDYELLGWALFSPPEYQDPTLNQQL